MLNHLKSRTHIADNIGYVDKVYEKLKWMVSVFDVPPRAQLNIGLLSDSLSVSRTPVREALNRISAHGLIESKQNYGFYNRALDLKLIEKHYGLIHVLEKFASQSYESLCKDKRKEIGNYIVNNCNLLQGSDCESRLKIRESISNVFISVVNNSPLWSAYEISNLFTRYVNLQFLQNCNNVELYVETYTEISEIISKDKLSYLDISEKLNGLSNVHIESMDGLVSLGLMAMLTKSNSFDA